MNKDQRPHYTQPVKSPDSDDYQYLIEAALNEDAPEGDVTSESIFDRGQTGSARIVSRETGILCGRPVVEAYCKRFRETTGHAVEISFVLNDGDAFQKGDTIAGFSGPVAGLLRAERPVLNFLQYLSGISSTVSAAAGLAPDGIYILDTRKTLPGYRKLAKYAVYTGGGTNHRISLSDMAMVKDNHIAAAGNIEKAVSKIRAKHPDVPVEVEVDSVSQIAEALSVQPDVILLDNMNEEQIREAAELIRSRSGDRVFIEVSGGFTPERLKELAGIGKAGVSMGYLTHTTRFLDLSLEFEI